MNVPRRILAFCVLPMSLAVSTASWSQTAIIDGDPIIENETAVVPVDPDADLLDGNSSRVIVRERNGPAVYGWQSCGTYFFWNGERCVDARVAPGNR